MKKYLGILLTVCLLILSTDILAADAGKSVKPVEKILKSIREDFHGFYSRFCKDSYEKKVIETQCFVGDIYKYCKTGKITTDEFIQVVSEVERLYKNALPQADPALVSAITNISKQVAAKDYSAFQDKKFSKVDKIVNLNAANKEVYFGFLQWHINGVMQSTSDKDVYTNTIRIRNTLKRALKQKSIIIDPEELKSAINLAITKAHKADQNKSEIIFKTILDELKSDCFNIDNYKSILNCNSKIDYCFPCFFDYHEDDGSDITFTYVDNYDNDQYYRSAKFEIPVEYLSYSQTCTSPACEQICKAEIKLYQITPPNEATFAQSQSLTMTHENNRQTAVVEISGNDFPGLLKIIHFKLSNGPNFSDEFDFIPRANASLIDIILKLEHVKDDLTNPELDSFGWTDEINKDSPLDEYTRARIADFNIDYLTDDAQYYDDITFKVNYSIAGQNQAWYNEYLYEFSTKIDNTSKLFGENKPHDNEALPHNSYDFKVIAYYKNQVAGGLSGKWNEPNCDHDFDFDSEDFELASEDIPIPTLSGISVTGTNSGDGDSYMCIPKIKITMPAKDLEGGTYNCTEKLYRKKSSDPYSSYELLAEYNFSPASNVSVENEYTDSKDLELGSYDYKAELYIGTTLIQTPLESRNNLIESELNDTKKSWTVLIYADDYTFLAGEDEVSFHNQIDRLVQLGSTNNVNYVIYYNASKPEYRGVFEITAQHSLKKMDWLNVYPNTFAIKDFVENSKLRYPATNYGLVLAGHGSGATKEDKTWNGTKIWDLETKISETCTNYQFIYFYSCLMGQLEVFYQLKNLTNYIIASERVVNSASQGSPTGDVYDFRAQFQYLNENYSYSVENVVKGIVEANVIPTTKQYTLCAISTMRLTSFKSSLSTFCNIAKPYIKPKIAEFKQVIFKDPSSNGDSHCPQTGYPWKNEYRWHYYDFGNFLNKIINPTNQQEVEQDGAVPNYLFSEPLRNAANTMKQTYQSLVIALKTDNPKGYTGCSIFMPANLDGLNNLFNIPDSYWNRYTNASYIKFAETEWQNFLKELNSPTDYKVKISGNLTTNNGSVDLSSAKALAVLDGVETELATSSSSSMYYTMTGNNYVIHNVPFLYNGTISFKRGSYFGSKKFESVAADLTDQTINCLSKNDDLYIEGAGATIINQACKFRANNNITSNQLQSINSNTIVHSGQKIQLKPGVKIKPGNQKIDLKIKKFESYGGVFNVVWIYPPYVPNYDVTFDVEWDYYKSSNTQLAFRVVFYQGGQVGGQEYVKFSKDIMNTGFLSGSFNTSMPMYQGYAVCEILDKATGERFEIKKVSFNKNEGSSLSNDYFLKNTNHVR